jgi:hypothetical protein
MFRPNIFQKRWRSSDDDHRERTDRTCGGVGQNDNRPRQPLRPPGAFCQVAWAARGACRRIKSQSSKASSTSNRSSVTGLPRLARARPSLYFTVFEMQGELLGGKRVTRTVVAKHSKCFPQPHVTVGVGGQTSQHLGDPGRASSMFPHTSAAAASPGSLSATTVGFVSLRARTTDRIATA